MFTIARQAGTRFTILSGIRKVVSPVKSTLTDTGKRQRGLPDTQQCITEAQFEWITPSKLSENIGNVGHFALNFECIHRQGEVRKCSHPKY